MSTHRFGAAFAKGIPAARDAYAYIIEGEISGELSSRAFSKASMFSCSGLIVVCASVEPHQIITSLEAPVLLLNSSMSASI